jgi:hypothetical protein
MASSCLPNFASITEPHLKYRSAFTLRSLVTLIWRRVTSMKSAQRSVDS